jgi:hypothetical protein
MKDFPFKREQLKDALFTHGASRFVSTIETLGGHCHTGSKGSKILLEQVEDYT